MAQIPGISADSLQLFGAALAAAVDSFCRTATHLKPGGTEWRRAK